ncbi:hypothetical protein [Nostoc sp.]|uniref:hypothetical protein n=1 Tax=Nostoc sp. TaxID=1180 RepID=UPI002FFC31A7
MVSKPDCTGRRFGMLTVLGHGDRTTYQKSNNKLSYRYLWRLRCDCGKEIQVPRGAFDRKNGGQVSCGCKRKNGLVDNKRRPKDITGIRFDSLVAIALTGRKDSQGKPLWLFQCDCGRTREISLSQAGRQAKKYRLNCRDKIHIPGAWYPPCPIPYPEDAAKILTKYLHLTELKYKQIDSEIEDYKRDKLIRAAWIVAYRRRQGEKISELHESGIISKHLRYSSIHIFWKRKMEEYGGMLYDVSNYKREIGGRMANLTSHNYPELELEGTRMLPTNNLQPLKRLKFSRR